MLDANCDGLSIIKYIRQLASGFLPEKIKSFLLVLIDSRVRARFVQDIRIVSQQKNILNRRYPSDAQRLIIFLVPGVDIVNGGVMSICSLYSESRKLKHVHNAEVLICSLSDKRFYPYHLRHRKNRILKYTKFKNDIEILDLKETLQYFKKLNLLTIHVPELFVENFMEVITGNNAMNEFYHRINCNIMLQNIKMLPSPDQISNLKKLVSTVTFTTAHDKYTSQEVRDYVGCPLHLFSVWASPEQYSFKKYSEKKELLVVSPDRHPSKQTILDRIKQAHPVLEIRIVENISYETFKQWMSDAKWTLTFGEGLDGYLGEGIFSGAIGFAVYNEEFFTQDFTSFETIYKSHEHLMETISKDIQKYNNEAEYERYQKRQYDLLCSLYDYKNYVSNINKYYQGNYDYP